MKKIEITTSNDNCYLIELENNSVSQNIMAMLKHLYRLPLRFGILDNPYTCTKDAAIKQLIEYAGKLGIDVNPTELASQKYLNYLHSIYEKNYNGNDGWLQFHEPIHVLENRALDQVDLLYDERAGFLDKKYQFDELLLAQTKIFAGECIVGFSELGKTPYRYWQNGEPDDIVRLCELSKPMLRFHFKITINLIDKNTIPEDLEEFNQWFSKYKAEWCNHWGIPDWSTEQIFGHIKVGRLLDFENFCLGLKQGHVPIKLRIVND